MHLIKFQANALENQRNGHYCIGMHANTAWDQFERVNTFIRQKIQQPPCSRGIDIDEDFLNTRSQYININDFFLISLEIGKWMRKIQIYYFQSPRRCIWFCKKRWKLFWSANGVECALCTSCVVWPGWLMNWLMDGCVNWCNARKYIRW